MNAPRTAHGETNDLSGTSDAAPPRASSTQRRANVADEVRAAHGDTTGPSRTSDAVPPRASTTAQRRASVADEARAAHGGRSSTSRREGVSSRPLSSAVLLTLLAGCVTTARGGDVRSVEHVLSSRAGLELTLPSLTAGDDTPHDVDELLKARLTTDAAVKIALLNNREGRAALAELGIIRGNAVQSAVLPNPTAEFEMRAPGGPQPLQIDIGADFELSALWLAGLRGGVAESELEAAKLETADLLLALAFCARVAFYEAQAAQERYALWQTALEVQQASYAAAVELSRVGNIPRLQLTQELTAVEQTRVQVAAAENAWLDAREALTRALGLSGARTGWTLAGELPLPAEPSSDADAEKKAIAASLELQALNQRAIAASRKAGVANALAVLPQLSAGFHGERDANLWELGAHLAVALPVFDRAQGHRLAAKSELQLAEARAQSHAVQVRSAVREAQNRVESASRRARHYAQRLVPARQETLKETLLQYNAMQLGVFEVLAARRAVTETALDAVDAKAEAWRARARLDLLLAGGKDSP